MTTFFTPAENATLDPGYFNYLNDQRRSVDDRYKASLASNDYERGQIDQNRAASIGNLTKQFAENRRTLSQGIAGRGLANSGIWQRKVAGHLGDRNQAFSDLQNQWSADVNRLAIARQALEAGRGSQLAELHDQEAQRRADTAAMIRNNLQGWV